MSRWYWNYEERECYDEGKRDAERHNHNYSHSEYSGCPCDKAYFDGKKDYEREERQREEEREAEEAEMRRQEELHYERQMQAEQEQMYYEQLYIHEQELEYENKLYAGDVIDAILEATI